MPPKIKQTRSKATSAKPQTTQGQPVHAKFNEAFALHQKGQLTEAKALYEEVLTRQPL